MSRFNAGSVTWDVSCHETLRKFAQRWKLVLCLFGNASGYLTAICRNTLLAESYFFQSGFLFPAISRVRLQSQGLSSEAGIISQPGLGLVAFW